MPYTTYLNAVTNIERLCSEHGPPPPGVIVAARKMIQDPNYETQYAERVPYVIAKGEPGSRLVDRAMDPYEFLQDR
jgi:DNA polymerase zeta